MAVTTMDELKHYAEGTEVELSGFAEGQPFVVKLKRPSLMLLAQNGDIPNSKYYVPVDNHHRTDTPDKACSCLPAWPYRQH